MMLREIGGGRRGSVTVAQRKACDASLEGLPEPPQSEAPLLHPKPSGPTRERPPRSERSRPQDLSEPCAGEAPSPPRDPSHNLALESPLDLVHPVQRRGIADLEDLIDRLGFENPESRELLGTQEDVAIMKLPSRGEEHPHLERAIGNREKALQGLIVILRQFISNDQYTENHCYRVSIYAAKIASYMHFNSDQIEDVRSAALLHDLGKLEISRNLLHKAARLTDKEYQNIKSHVEKGAQILKPVDGPLQRIIPIILGHHEHYDGSGYYESQGEGIPIESRVLAVADVYDSLISDRPYRKAMSPYEVKEIIENGAGTDFDPRVVHAFLQAFRRGDLEVPNVVV